MNRRSIVALSAIAALQLGMIALVLPVMGALAWNGGAARAQGFPTTAWPIHDLQSGRCLDADLPTIGANGTKVQLWDCWGGQNQQWRMNNDGTIVNVQSGRCLDADLGTINANGTKMQLWDCWGGNNQKWGTIGNGWISTSGPINSPPRCLDGDLSTIGANGTKVQLWDCFTPTTPNQNWWSRSEGGWAIKVSQSGRCLDADLGTIVNNGTIVQLWDCGNQQDQTWRIDPSGAIVNLQSHRCLDADLGSIGTNGTKVQLWDCLGGQNQNWNWPGFAPGSGISGSAITNGQSQQCLDADLPTIGANGTKVQLWACFDGPPQNQFWVNPLMD